MVLVGVPRMTHQIDVPELYSRIGTMEAKIDLILEGMDAAAERRDRAHAQLENRVDKLEDRLSTVEKFRFVLLGAGSILGGIIGYLMPYLRSIFPI